MKQPEKNQPAKEENRKMHAEKQSQDKPVREGEPNSIHDENADTANYPHKNEADKQFDAQSEFIDRNSNSKDKN